MLKGISWTDFCVTFFISLVIYYGYFFIRFYAGSVGRRITESWSGKQNFSFQVPSAGEKDDIAEAAPFENEVQSNEEVRNKDLDEVDVLLAEIKALMDGTFPEADLGNEIATVLVSHPDLGSSPFRPSLNELIKSELDKNILAHHFDTDDVDKLWDRAV